MTDDVIAMRKRSPYVVGRTVPGAPPSRDRRRRFHAPPHLRARPCVACLPRLDGCERSAWPILPASPSALSPCVHRPTYPIPRAQPAHYLCGHPTFSVHRRRAGVEARPYGGHPHLTHVGTNPSVTALRAATAPLSGEPRRGRRFAAFTHLFTTMRIPTFR